jgi:hypothetical protein
LQHFTVKVLHSYFESAHVSGRIRAIQDIISVELKRVAKFNLQKQGLMQDLLTGKVSVNPGANDREAA